MDDVKQILSRIERLLKVAVGLLTLAVLGIAALVLTHDAATELVIFMAAIVGIAAVMDLLIRRGNRRVRGAINRAGEAESQQNPSDDQ
jgi:hypothetical protein